MYFYLNHPYKLFLWQDFQLIIMNFDFLKSIYREMKSAANVLRSYELFSVVVLQNQTYTISDKFTKLLFFDNITDKNIRLIMHNCVKYIILEVHVFTF